MIFRIITLVFVFGLAAWLCHRRYQKSPEYTRTKAGIASLKAYAAWMLRTTAPLSAARGRRALELTGNRLLELYPDTLTRWVAIGLGASFIYLGASGLGFAVFTTRGMFGLPLVLHVVAGGAFAACLAAFVVLRAKDNVAAPESFVFDRFTLREVPRTLPRDLVKPVLFWVFVVSGLALTVTALGSMLRFFTFDTQVGLIEVHRYSALVSALAAIALFDAVFLAKD
jgi:hypothetical protein